MKGFLVIFLTFSPHVIHNSSVCSSLTTPDISLELDLTQSSIVKPTLFPRIVISTVFRTDSDLDTYVL